MQVQGIIAEYERVKAREQVSPRPALRSAGRARSASWAVRLTDTITTPSRREKARPGMSSQFAEAQVVREIFTWVGIEGCSLSQVCRRLSRTRAPYPHGQVHWDRATVLGMLRKPGLHGDSPLQRSIASRPVPGCARVGESPSFHGDTPPKRQTPPEDHI